MGELAVRRSRGVGLAFGVGGRTVEDEEASASSSSCGNGERETVASSVWISASIVMRGVGGSVCVDIEPSDVLVCGDLERGVLENENVVREVCNITR